MTELRLCTREDYERVGLGQSFDEAFNTADYNELCVNNWQDVILSENKKVTVYQDLRI